MSCAACWLTPVYPRYLGPGGAGKTRLATEFARAQGHRFADGQITIELVEVRDPALVPDAFARAAGIRLLAEDTIGTLVHRLISSEVLLLVDNCEHLTEAAAKVVARLPPVTLFRLSLDFGTFAANG